MPRARSNARKKTNARQKRVAEEETVKDVEAELREMLPSIDGGTLKMVVEAVTGPTGTPQDEVEQILVNAKVTDVNNTIRMIAAVCNDESRYELNKIKTDMQKLKSETEPKKEEATEKVRLTVHEEGTPETAMQKHSKGPAVRRTKANGTGGTQCGTKVQAPGASGPKGTLGVDLGGMMRLPKPRSIKEINELKWAHARITALKEITEEFHIPGDLEDYYARMCKVGQQALIAVIHNKTQAIYDKVMANVVKRQNKKKPKGKA